MNRKLEVGPTISEAFSIYGAQAGVLLPIAFWLFLVVAIVNALVGTGSLLLLPLVLAVGTIAGTLYQGVVVNLVRDVQGGQRGSSAGDLVNAAMPMILPLIGAGLLSGIAIGVGLILLLVPGLILVTIWAVIAPVIVVEHSGVMDSFGRSRELVRGNGWPVLGAIVSAGVIVLVASVVFGAIASGVANGVLVRIVFSAIAATITAPVSALVASVIYFRLKEIEGSAAPAADDPLAPPLPSPPPPAV
jgi:hypothetical protein